MLLAVVLAAVSLPPGGGAGPLLADVRSAGPGQDDPVPRALFDGTSLAGWDGDPRFWSVRDGAIVGESTARNPCGRTTYLIHEGAAPGDFEVSFAFRITGGNSGLQFRSFRGDGQDPWDVGGYQADIEDGPNWTGCLYEQYGRAVFVQRGQSVLASLGAAPEVDRFADGAELLKAVRPGEWNTYRVRAVGPRIELDVNGVRMCEVTDLDSAHARLSGLLAFQMHAGAPMKVELRDILLLDLGGEEASVPPRRTPAEPDGPTEDEAARGDAAGRVDSGGERHWETEPRWIWASPDPQPYEEAWFAKSFAVEGRVLSATVWASCDNEMELFLNGERVAVGEDWMRPVCMQVGPKLREGRNVVAAWGRNEEGPAAFWFELVVEQPDDAVARFLSDETWLASGAEIEGWKDAERAAGKWGTPSGFGPLGTGVWGTPTGTTDGTPSMSLDPALIELPPGFRAELVYQVPRRAEGSWVSMTFDDRGRVIASDQYGALYRLTLTAGGPPVQAEKLDVALGEAQGLLYAFDSLYVVVSGAGAFSSGLYRVTDSDGDDRLDTSVLLKAFDGGGEHGPHGVVAGPDGKSIYVVGGNHTMLPAGITTFRVPPVWDEDLLLPRIADPGGHAVGRMAPGAWVVRTDPEGRAWELVAAGMRNPYDLAFDDDGELFTFDADMEWDTGLPWYRPTRVLHLVSGAEYGWRAGSGKWPDYYPDSLPSVVDVGLSSPTGIAFGTKTAFPEVYRRALFVADWAYGTVYAVHLFRRGASFGGVLEPFARGKPLPLTDIEVGPDGALYLLTGGRRLQSGLYRIVWEGGADGVPAVEIPPADPNHGEARRRRRTLDEMHVLPPSPGTAQRIFESLDSDDPFLRFSGRTALEHLPPSRWAALALAETRPVASLHALLALVRAGDASYAPGILDALARLDLATLDEETLLAALRVYGLVLIRHGDPDAERIHALGEHLGALYPHGSDRVDRELVQLLVRLEAPGVVQKTLARMALASTQEEEIHYLHVLRTLRTGWTLAQRETYFRFLDERVPHYRGGVSLQKYVEHIREDAIANLSDEERTALRPVLEAPDRDVPRTAVRKLAAFVREWKRDEVLALLPRATTGRSYAGGVAAWDKATCVDCHRIAEEGGATGPDLTGMVSRLSPLELVETILAPSDTISDQYQDTEVWTVDGELFVGRLGPVTDGWIALHTIPPDEKDIEIREDDVEELRPHSLSRMPEGLLDVLTEEELLDLLGYVLSGGRADDPIFAGGD